MSRQKFNLRSGKFSIWLIGRSPNGRLSIVNPTPLQVAVGVPMRTFTAPKLSVRSVSGGARLLRIGSLAEAHELSPNSHQILLRSALILSSNPVFLPQNLKQRPQVARPRIQK